MAGQSPWQQVGNQAAERYQRDLVPAMFADWAPRLVDAARVQAGEHVLDVACGTGVVARLAAARVGSQGRVVGLDVNSGMLSVAGALPAIAGASIEWCEASALDMPLPDQSFDVVLCQQGVQQFPDRPRALREMRRVLRPGGRLAAAVWGHIEGSPGFVALVEALERHIGVAAANNRRAPFALGDPTALLTLVTEAGFRNVEVSTLVETARFPSPDKLVEYQLAASPLSTLGTITDQALDAVLQDVRSSLQSYVDDNGLTFPMEAHLVLASR
jgi:SAM-dependent methyltransferase